jgi:soluble P-type ATPase
MISIDIPGFGGLELRHLVLDYNGTIAFDGRLLEGVGGQLRKLAEQLEIHVLTADTFGSVANNLEELPCIVHVLPRDRQDVAKLRYIEKLGAVTTVSVGNGRNDAKMLQGSALGIAVLQQEGAASVTLVSADLVIASITDALDLLLHPRRLIATLRT